MNETTPTPSLTPNPNLETEQPKRSSTIKRVCTAIATTVMALGISGADSAQARSTNLHNGNIPIPQMQRRRFDGGPHFQFTHIPASHSRRLNQEGPSLGKVEDPQMIRFKFDDWSIIEIPDLLPPTRE